MSNNVNMDISKRNNLVSTLNAATEEEQKLKSKNEFLISSLKNMVKIDSTDGIYEAEFSTINDTLVKKLLEYREVRNYTVLEKDEEENRRKELQHNCEELKNNVSQLVHDINNKQNIVCSDCSPTNINHIKKLQELSNVYTTSLNKLCQLIKEKTEVSIRLENMKSNLNRKYTSLDDNNKIQYKKLLLKEKELEDQLLKMKKKINEHENKLREMNLKLKELKDNNLRIKFEGLSDDVTSKRKLLKTECIKIESLKNKYTLMKKGTEELSRKYAVLHHRDLHEDYEEIKDNTPLLNNQLLQLINMYNKNKMKAVVFKK